MGLFTSILGAVAGPIASLFKKKEKPQKVENSVDYVKMRDNAIKAGFNPLTVLRNGGSAGFGTQISHPALSSGFGAGIADALATGISAWAAYDPMAEKRADLEYEVAQEQLRSVQLGNALSVKRMREVPTYAGASGRYSSGGFVASHPSGAAGTPIRASPNTPGVTDPYKGFWHDVFGLSANPAFQDTEQAETRLGDPLSWVAGLGVLGGDIAHSYGPAVKKAYQKAVAQQAAPQPSWYGEGGRMIADWFAPWTQPAQVEPPRFPGKDRDDDVAGRSLQLPW